MPAKQEATEYDLIVGREVRRLRVERGWTAKTLAKRMGVAASFISNVEHGLRSLKGRLPQLAAVFRVSARHFTSLYGLCSFCKGTGLSRRRRHPT